MGLIDGLRDREQQLGRPVRVGLVGVGQMGRGLAAQVGRVPGMTLSAAIDLDPERAAQALTLAGAEKSSTAPSDPARVIAGGGSVAVSDTAAVSELGLDVVVDATGSPEVGAALAYRSLLAGVHVVTLNVEMDVTCGLLLDQVAQAAGTVYTVAHGDEPVCTYELVEYAHDLAFEVVCAGKGKNNPFRPEAVPDELADEAARKHMNPKMLASFVDGSKTMIEMAALANATGLPPDRPGMHGPKASVEQLADVFRPRDEGGLLSAPGRVDFAIGPAPGVFVVVTAEDETVAEEMAYLGMGEGPYWTLYRPYHLASIEAPRSIAAAVVEGRPHLRPAGWTAEVVAVAKRDLQPGDRIDGVGGVSVYGTTYPAGDVVDMLPLGLAEHAQVVAPVPAGEPVPRASVEVADSVIAKLRALQDTLMTTPST